MEVWRELQHPEIAEGFLISNYRRIKAASNVDDEPVCASYHSSNGYDFIPLLLRSKNSIFPEFNIRYFPIDELVGRAFVPPSEDLIDHFIKIEHMDGDTRNSNYDNLKWVEDIEEWKPIKDFENYQISNHGRVKSLRNDIILKPAISRKGYLRITLCDSGFEKGASIHRLVMETFHPIQDMKKFGINHINEIKTDNFDKNLEWISLLDNNNFGTRTAKTRKPVVCIETGAIYNSIKQAAEFTGACLTSIGDCCHGRRETAGGLHWKFYEDN